MIKKVLIIIITLTFFCSNAYALSMETRYDIYFKIYSKRFFGNSIHWHWFKSQAIAESNLNPKAVSHVGARGIMQLMPFTSKEVAKELGIKNMPFDPELNIMMGIYYDFKMFRIWKRCKIMLERIRFMFASYNAGAGWIIKANKLAPKEMKYKFIAIEKFLPKVTGRHSKETISYVHRIEKIYISIKKSAFSETSQTLSVIFTISAFFKKIINKLFSSVNNNQVAA